MSDTDELAALRSKVEELERRLGISRKQEIAEQVAALAKARKQVFPPLETAASRAFSHSVKSLAARNNLVVEWTVRDLSVDAGVTCGCICFA